jgi:hypothetical protein
MGLSRLENFLKNVKGEILYVDPSSIDSTDSVENQGNSLTRPFKTIQRALIEAARFSYQKGKDNDRFGRTTILLYPGEHIVDNRPGWIPDGDNNFRLRSGEQSNNMPPFDLSANFNLDSDDNILYKINSIHGGVIVPRGTSIVGLDLRKTKIRPKYVPDPENSNIERSAVFRLTGSCYLWQFSIFDADPNTFCFKDYTTNTFVPNFSHSKLTVFEYADGVNPVNINDEFQTFSSNFTDLDFYYQKVGRVYGQSSGRAITPEFLSTALDIEPKVDEFRIVGSAGDVVGITSIRAGDGSTSSTTVTVTLAQPLEGADVDTPIKIQGVGARGYDGQYVISEKLSDSIIQYNVQNSPVNPLPSVTGATFNIIVDTVTSASPYVFNCSLRSVYGMCGLHADGSKATGFKSMVVAQYTGIGLQKDPNAFVKYDTVSGTYRDKTASGNENIQSDSRARFKPNYENYHIKASNDSFIQVVSVFAIGYAQHFLSESGGDLSITNSNSNFGAKSLVSSGYRVNAFPRDDVGYITHIIPPKQFEPKDSNFEFLSLDVPKIVSVGNTYRLYLYNETNESTPPNHVIEGYRIGAKSNDSLNLLVTNSGVTTQYSARIVMPNTAGSATELTTEKSYEVGRTSVGINLISNNVITLKNNHAFVNGESIRIISSNGHLPDGLIANQIYYVITSGISIATGNQIKLAQTYNDAVNDKPITINNKGGVLKVESRVSDKKSGDIGHPIQWDSTQNQWYVSVASTANNSIYPVIRNLGVSRLGDATARTFVTRKVDNRNLEDSLYKFRYVIPSDSPVTARPPIEGFIIQESNNTIGLTDAEVAYQYSNTTSTLSNSTELRNFRIIANALWANNVANVITEVPHELKVGSKVEVINISSTNNPTGIANSSFNGTFTITGISSSKHFSYSLETNPGTFSNDTVTRNRNLPIFKKKNLFADYQVYKSKEIQKYVPGQKDGIYHLTVVNSSSSPTVSPFIDYKLSQPVQYLYPQLNRDNILSDPKPTSSFALAEPVGQVVINDPQKSLTRETISRWGEDFRIGIGISNILSNNAGTAHTVYTSIDHGFNRIIEVSIINAGSNYGTGIGTEVFFNVKLDSTNNNFGKHATARVTAVNGAVTGVEIIDGGSAAGVGNTFALTGTATTTGHVPAIVSVSRIYSNVGDTVRITDINFDDYDNYNNYYRITGISNGRDKQIELQSITAISPRETIGIGLTYARTGNLTLVGPTLSVSSLTYDNTSGIATFVTSSNHGLKVDNKTLISGANSSLYNGEFVIKKVNSLTSFSVNVGVGSSSPATTGTIYVHPTGFSPNGGKTTIENENLSGRLIAEYDNLTSNLLGPVSNVTTTTITLDTSLLDIKIGDYLLIDSEIFRVRSTVTSNNVSVFRGLFGTARETHLTGAIIRRIKPRPVELRRNSIIRASGHTFEYLGFGPGNYSTALPDRQDRILSPQEELLSQTFKFNGGIVIFTGMNSEGDFYVGNTKTNASNGTVEVFDSPIPTVTGEEISNNAEQIGFSYQSSSEITVDRSIKVEGGSDGNLVSSFGGPVIFNNKLTSTSDKGIETNSLFIQGDATISRKYTVGISTPIISGNIGDVVYNANPESGGTLGWTYTSDNEWKKFGLISTQTDTTDIVVNSATGNFIGSFSGDGRFLFNVDSRWQPDAIGIHTNTPIGVGTTSAKAGYGLYVEGSMAVNGTLRLFEIIEKATVSAGILTTGVRNIDLGDNNVYYFTSNAQGNWTINFRGGPSQTLNSFLEIGDSMTVAIMTSQGPIPYYNSTVQIDGLTVTPRYYGGSQITSGNANSIDVYTYVIIKTANNTFTVLYSQSQYA